MINFSNKILNNIVNKYKFWINSLSKKRSRQGLYEFLSQQFCNINSGANVLTVGSGGEVNFLLNNFAINNNFNVTSIDIDPEKNPDILGDICKYILPENTYDCVVVSEVLEHLYSPSDGIDNIYKSLKFNGNLVLTTPFVLPIHDKPNDYFRFTKYGLQILLSKFKNIIINPRNNYYESIDVLWLRLLQTDKRGTLIISCLLIPIIYFLKRPITVLLGIIAPCSEMTTGYVVSAVK